MNRVVLIIVAAVSALMLSACSEKVPYTVADHYFLRNDVTGEVPSKLGNRADFEKYFGMAAVMGVNGLPSPIDFDNQYVIAVTLPQTNRNTEISPVSLTRGKDHKVVFKYKVELGDAMSYSINPILIIIVNKEFDGDVVLKQE